MKDLYTFDHSLSSALKTYEEARAAYNRLFDELKLPYLVAEATSGDIGGDLSHEYHLPSPIGEDNVIKCGTCTYVANEELAAARPILPQDVGTEAQVWRSITKDKRTLVNVWYPAKSNQATLSHSDINTHILKALVPGLDTSLEDALPLWESTLNSPTSDQRTQLLNIIDYRLGEQFKTRLRDDTSGFSMLPQDAAKLSLLDVKYMTTSTKKDPINTIRIRDGDYCPRCATGRLTVHKAIELGHTFHLGTKYSEALDARVQVPSALVEGPEPDSAKPDSMVNVPMQMGCHGIGVSRIIGAVAHHLADAKGLNWPRAIAPFEVVVIPGRGMEEAARLASTALNISSSSTFPPIDVALDDRGESFPWKMNDADLVGYPVIVVLGRKWMSDQLCEVQCRQLGSEEFVPLYELKRHVNKLLAQL